MSLNAADYDANVSTPFEFYDPPGGLNISTATGPVLGGTPIVVHGANLTGGSDRRCRFTPMIFGFPTPSAHAAAWKLKTEVVASRYDAVSDAAGGMELRCVTPSLPEMVARVSVEVSLNGQQFTREGVAFDVTPREGGPEYMIPARGVFGKTSPTAFSFVPDVRSGERLKHGLPVVAAPLHIANDGGADRLASHDAGATFVDDRMDRSNTDGHHDTVSDEPPRVNDNMAAGSTEREADLLRLFATARGEVMQ